ncbi:MAG: hypothetical protein A3G32_09430 [Deltaproteobacteria bacterium RIFCSPLOWO2_12_FULL_40_28]|nr:MAG: hypothetical protein A3C45_07700 [Deltaproteobacteria bacterium RIFCSPHIGHO2_02_FULL_40_28]OGQ20753.1 MAG: hypothetical protein A3E27_07365 [Deltaproteobacteria bacterium RIFCSPHIGHO2_12_FULL_40_32]OGQ41301.1 MAG: hypothetical protein A3I69_04285 [Deltaproteobacteria bacterium RIFCSPLOWO2_02_FULL_40_36]OGQ55365.1 MAG: hypothetical protein A3G32_09430 [Deltaproteobacteria bacterium RIFCSPLOWO2_12_FULL_40_28]
MNQSRTLLAVALSMVVFYVYYTWINPPPKNPQTVQKASVQTEPPVPTTSLVSAAVLSPQKILKKSPVMKKTLENDFILALLSSEDGVFKEWQLKKFSQTAGTTEPFIDLINPNLGDSSILKTTLGNSAFDETAHFQILENPNQEKSLVLQWESKDFRVVKTITLSKDQSYVVDVALEVTNVSSQNQILKPTLWIERPQKKEIKTGGFFSFIKQPNPFYPLFFKEGKLISHNNWSKLTTTEEKGRIAWAGITDRYFLLAMISRQEAPQALVSSGKKGDLVFTSFSYGETNLAPGQGVKQQFSAYLGPKERNLLEKIGVSLEKSVDYGYLGFFCIPILWLLIFFQKILSNWGLAIIALTFFIKMILHPVNKKSMESMKAMQKLQPKLKEIREKYKDNREKQNQEMMLLFKSYKVNPMSGCLPLVLQMPIYFALYKVLWSAIELYHAPFFWFYKDLAAPDPYFISPVLLSVVMVLQQKYNPQASTMDPAQQKMMMFMPIMFSVFLIFLPFGLVLYIFFNMLVSFIQQYMIHEEVTFLDLLKRLKVKKTT